MPNKKRLLRKVEARVPKELTWEACLETPSEHLEVVEGRNDLWGFCCEGKHCVNYYANKVTFGGGTHLRIRPNVTPSPSVYRLTSKDDEDLEMCLITDYSPDKLKSETTDSKTYAIVETVTSEDKHEASYLSTYWTNKNEMQCSAIHEGFGELEGQDPENGASAVCVTEVSQNFRTDERLNLLSFSQLGLKIILMKGIIFNVLITMLMWKKKNESNLTGHT